MINIEFDEFKRFLYGYTEYLGMEFNKRIKIKRNKSLKEFIIYLEHEEYRTSRNIIIFQYGDFKNEVTVILNSTSDTASREIRMHNLLEQVTNDKNGIKFLFGKTNVSLKADLFGLSNNEEFTSKLKSKEELHKYFRILESIHFFALL